MPDDIQTEPSLIVRISKTRFDRINWFLFLRVMPAITFVGFAVMGLIKIRVLPESFEQSGVMIALGLAYVSILWFLVHWLVLTRMESASLRIFASVALFAIDSLVIVGVAWAGYRWYVGLI